MAKKATKQTKKTEKKKIPAAPTIEELEAQLAEAKEKLLEEEAKLEKEAKDKAQLKKKLETKEETKKVLKKKIKTDLLKEQAENKAKAEELKRKIEAEDILHTQTKIPFLANYADMISKIEDPEKLKLKLKGVNNAIFKHQYQAGNCDIFWGQRFIIEQALGLKTKLHISRVKETKNPKTKLRDVFVAFFPADKAPKASDWKKYGDPESIADLKT